MSLPTEIQKHYMINTVKEVTADFHYIKDG